MPPESLSDCSLSVCLVGFLLLFFLTIMIYVQSNSASPTRTYSFLSQALSRVPVATFRWGNPSSTASTMVFLSPFTFPLFGRIFQQNRSSQFLWRAHEIPPMSQYIVFKPVFFWLIPSCFLPLLLLHSSAFLLRSLSLCTSASLHSVWHMPIGGPSTF